MRSLALKLMVGSALVVGTVAGATGIDAIRAGHAANEAAQQVQAVSPAADTTANNLSRAFRTAAHNALPGVVHIQVEGTRRVAAGPGLPDALRGTPWEDMFGGRGGEQEQPVAGAGSGFVFRPDGYVLTNNHVVENATRVTVITNDRREYLAEVVGRDPNTDLAVLKVEAEGLPVIPFGDSDAMQVGDWVVALGYPLNLGSTVTAGIVSAKGRSLGLLGSPQDLSQGAPPLESFIQTDAAINPGNSGGPLVDLNGRVVGINSAIASPTGYSQGYGFAVPANLAQRVANDLIAHGEVRRPRIGVLVAPVTEADRELFGLPSMNGALISAVEEGLPAERAGLRMGDVVVAVDEQAIRDYGELTERLALYQPGEEVTLTILRDRARREIAVKLGRFEAVPVAQRTAPEPRVRGAAVLGFEAVEITPQMAREMRLDVREGVVVTRRTDGSRAPVGQGTIILQVNDQAIASLEDLNKAAAGISPGDPVKLVVLTQGRRQMVTYKTR